MRPFEQVVTEHGVTVLRVCRAVVGPVDADDAWSETFLAALRAYPKLPPEADVRAWLVTIAHRKAIDIVRTRRRQPLPVAQPPDEGTVGGGRESDDAGNLVAEVQALPEKQRLAVAYHYLAGMPYAEVADLIGGTAEAARRAAADGIKKLRKNTPLLEGTR